MAHFLWNLHLLGFVASFIYFFFFSEIIPQLFHFIREDVDSVFLKIIFSLAGIVGFIVMAFLWEFSLPYKKSKKFRNVIDVYFNY